VGLPGAVRDCAMDDAGVSAAMPAPRKGLPEIEPAGIELTGIELAGIEPTGVGAGVSESAPGSGGCGVGASCGPYNAVTAPVASASVPAASGAPAAAPSATCSAGEPWAGAGVAPPTLLSEAEVEVEAVPAGGSATMALTCVWMNSGLGEPNAR
jgi:hypothetical protein